MAITVGDDVTMVVLLSVSVVFTLPTFFAPLQRFHDERSTDLTIGKMALLARLAILSWIAAVWWILAGIDLATLTTVGGFPVYYISWLCWAMAFYLGIYGMIQLVVWSDLNL